MIENVVARITFKQIMNTKFILHIYHHDNIYSKIISASYINNFFNRIMNIMCFINSNIYQRNNFTAKS